MLCPLRWNGRILAVRAFRECCNLIFSNDLMGISGCFFMDPDLRRDDEMGGLQQSHSENHGDFDLPKAQHAVPLHVIGEMGNLKKSSYQKTHHCHLFSSD